MIGARSQVTSSCSDWVCCRLGIAAVLNVTVPSSPEKVPVPSKASPASTAPSPLLSRQSLMAATPVASLPEPEACNVTDEILTGTGPSLRSSARARMLPVEPRPTVALVPTGNEAKLTLACAGST